MGTKRNIRLLLFALWLGLLGHAQNFPVQLIPQVRPPAPLYLSDYGRSDAVNGPLRLQLTLHDLALAGQSVRLKVYIEGNGLAIAGADLVAGAPELVLEGGVPLILEQADLAPYFRYGNLPGLSPDRYAQMLPEGPYRICFEVYDRATGSRLSGRSCATTLVFQNEPPFLTLPLNGSHITENDPTNIIFQWTPRHINVSQVAYTLELVEVWDNGVDPRQAFLSSVPVFETETTATSYHYGPADPLLLSGHRYAWRVTAKAMSGGEAIGAFKNQGHSEIFSFGYAQACDAPTGIAHEVKGATVANIDWEDPTTEVPDFTVRYRKKHGDTDEWFTAGTNANGLTLWDLAAGTTYEYQLREDCGMALTEWSPVQEFTTFLADNGDTVVD